VRQSNPEGQAAAAGGLDRERLFGKHHRVTGMDRDHRRSQIDARDFPTDDGQDRQRVPPEDL
jgi:hypothetical protein